MNTYTTSEVAKIIGIHPNTVRMYEEWGLIPLAERKPNGYRMFTDFHIEQLKLARIAFQIEALQNGLRKKVVETIKLSAKRDFDKALMFANEYLSQLQREQRHAKESICIAKQILSEKSAEHTLLLRRKEVSDHLDISMDTLRNWERNGLLQIKRKQNGYRAYTSDDIERLKMIRTLRLANYSLEAILRMLNALEHNPQVNIKQVLNTPQADADIVSVCDRLIVSLQNAEKNAEKMINIISFQPMYYFIRFDDCTNVDHLVCNFENFQWCISSCWNGNLWSTCRYGIIATDNGWQRYRSYFSDCLLTSKIWFEFNEVIDMKNKNFMYGILCAAGGAMIGFSANQLGAPIGTIGFTIGVALLVFAASKLNS